ncbi:hypothetical protein EYF80_017244 [Liparis tanakae]|uniref:Uncharacterized protein n=1 Tax=Liparis tanakae TaxID=230148 RepID=A0A4Z2I3F2_9TELE|nr:hypothetical protein EYF80_017244 [Liparis tanakae]
MSRRRSRRSDIRLTSAHKDTYSEFKRDSAHTAIPRAGPQRADMQHKRTTTTGVKDYNSHSAVQAGEGGRTAEEDEADEPARS